VSSNTQSELYDLAGALEKCPALATREKRSDIVAGLSPQVQGDVQRRDDRRDDILNIVRTCAVYPGGVEQLLEAVEYRDGEKPQFWDPVQKFAGLLIQKLNAEFAAAPVESSAPGPIRKFGLAIGISEYENGQPADRVLMPEQFTNLAFAANDANEFHRFLKVEGGYAVGPILVNRDATLRNILHALDDLRKKIKQSGAENPLVVVFFSGHGACDADGRNYLVPYDAKRNDLFGTALWSKHFDNALAELKTERLVVFLDACHAGAIGAEGLKDAELFPCDPQSLVGENEQQRRFVVASCLRGQHSRECDGRGIFTGHLLDLLRCRHPEAFASEEVDLWDLYGLLKQKVQQTAAERFDGALQEPYANLSGRTGIILAINSRLREERVAKERSYFAAFNAVLDSHGAARDCSELIRLKLEDFLDGLETAPELRRFFDFFRQAAKIWKAGDARRVADDCESLVRLFMRLTGESAPRQGYLPPPAPSREEVRASVAAVTAASAALNRGLEEGDQYAPCAANEKISGERLGITSAAPPPAQGQPERRRLPEEERRSVLEPIWKPLYLHEAKALQELLNAPGGVSQDDFMAWLVNTQPRNPAATPSWPEVCSNIANLFDQRWLAAEIVKPQSALSLRTGPNDDRGH